MLSKDERIKILDLDHADQDFIENYVTSREEYQQQDEVREDRLYPRDIITSQHGF